MFRLDNCRVRFSPMNAEIGKAKALTLEDLRLQWGRALMNAEMDALINDGQHNNNGTICAGRIRNGGPVLIDRPQKR
jgi:hypothetical protein